MIQYKGNEYTWKETNWGSNIKEVGVQAGMLVRGW